MKHLLDRWRPPKKERYSSQGTRIDAQLREIIEMLQSSFEPEIRKYYGMFKQNGDINTKDENGYTLLMRVIIYGVEDLFDILIDYFGTDINAKTDNGLTPLMIAVIHSKTKFVYELINKTQIDINAQSENGMTALMLSIDLEITQILLLHPQIDLNLKNEDNKTALEIFEYNETQQDEESEDNDESIPNLEIAEIIKKHTKKEFIF